MQIEIQRTRQDPSKYRVVTVDWEDKTVVLADNLSSQMRARQQAKDLAFQLGIPVINRVEDPKHYTFSPRP